MTGKTLDSRRAGFTLVETLTAAGVLSIVMVIIMGAYLFAMDEVGGDSLHVRYIDVARAAEQRFVNSIQAHTAVGVSSAGLEILNHDRELEFTIRFEDGDDDLDTVDDNVVLIDPDTSVDGDEIVLCSQVSPLGSEPMFQKSPTGRGAQMTLHVGEIAPGTNAVEHGRSYHGVEVRISATPRNSNAFMQ